MFKYIVKRILLAIVTIWAVATLTFFLMNLVPGGPFLSEKAISPQAQAALEAKYGLDKPMSQRYVNYMTGALHGDFGDSLKQRGRTVMSIISMKFPVREGRRHIRPRGADSGNTPWQYRRFEAGKAGGQCDQRDCDLRYRGAQFRDLYAAHVFLRREAGASAHDGSGERKALCDAGDCPVLLPHSLYYAADALLHAGRAGTGLYAYSQGKRTGGRKDTLQART